MKKNTMIFAGNLIFALGVAAFVIPGGMLSGGGTGIALFFNQLTGLPVAALVAAINLAALFAGYCLLGRAFFLSTVISSGLYPVCLRLLQMIIPAGGFTTDILLNTVFGGTLTGVGVGLILRSGASSGGIDIPALILSKKSGIGVSVFLYGFDVVILLSQAWYADVNRILYSIVMVFLTSFMIGRMMIAGKDKVQVMVISDQLETVNEFIIYTIERGTTYLYVKTGFKKERKRALISVMNRREIPVLMNWLEQTDPLAFTTIVPATEVRGVGFTLRKMSDAERSGQA